MNSNPHFGLGDANYPPYPPSMPGAPAALPPAPPPQPPAPPALPTINPSTLQAGHRYQILQLAPIPGAVVTSTADQAQAFFDSILPGALHMVSLTPAAGSHPTALIVDALLSTPIVLPSTMPLTDLGPTPAPSVAPPPPPPPPLPPPPAVVPAVPAAPTPQTFVFEPGSFPQAVTAAPGSMVSFGLPAGGTWRSVSVDTLGTSPLGASPVTPGSSAPVLIPAPPGPATVSASWVDASGSTQVGAAIFLPPDASLSTPIVDPVAVTAVQNLLNAAALQNSLSALSPQQSPAQPAPPPLQPFPVTGNPTDPAFVTQLAAFQQWLVNMAANPPGGTIAPAVVHVPTSGVLDYATLAALSMPL